MEVARSWETDMGIKRTVDNRPSRWGEENCHAVAPVDIRSILNGEGSAYVSGGYSQSRVYNNCLIAVEI